MLLNQAKILAVLVSIGLATLLFAPLAAEARAKTGVKVRRARVSISAIRGADERELENPTSRCLTPEIKKIYENAAAQMKKDAEKFGQGHNDAVADYRSTLDLVWGAMHEPYCGYGSRGLKAVKKSLLKSFERARADFLAAVK